MPEAATHGGAGEFVWWLEQVCVRVVCDLCEWRWRASRWWQPTGKSFGVGDLCGEWDGCAHSVRDEVERLDARLRGHDEGAMGDGPGTGRDVAFDVTIVGRIAMAGLLVKDAGSV